MIGSDFSVGMTVSFECLPGYSLIGETSLTCLHGISRNWNNPIPRCEGAFYSPQYKILILLLNSVLKLNDLSVSSMQLLTVSYNESVISRLQLMALYASPRVRFIALSQQYYYIMCDVKQCRASLW